MHISHTYIQHNMKFHFYKFIIYTFGVNGGRWLGGAKGVDPPRLGCSNPGENPG